MSHIIDKIKSKSQKNKSEAWGITDLVMSQECKGNMINAKITAESAPKDDPGALVEPKRTKRMVRATCKTTAYTLTILVKLELLRFNDEPKEYLIWCGPNLL